MLDFGHVGGPGSEKQEVSSYHVGVAPFDECRHECDRFVQSSKVLVQSMELLGEVGLRLESVCWLVQLWFLDTGVRSSQVCHTYSTALGGFRTLCLAKKYQF